MGAKTRYDLPGLEVCVSSWRNRFLGILISGNHHGAYKFHLPKTATGQTFFFLPYKAVDNLEIVNDSSHVHAERSRMALGFVATTSILLQHHSAEL